MKKIKFAVVGYGHIGKRHSEMISRNKESDMVAICDIKNESEISKKPLKVPLYSNVQSMIDSHPEIDVINIATPNGNHFDNAITALKNYKHVVIEKPITLTKSDAEKIINLSIKVKKYVFAVMQNRFSPPSVWLKELVDSKILGNLYLIQLNCFWNRDKRYYTPKSWHGKKDLDGGTLFTQFSHFIDILYWIFGDVTNIKSRLFDFNHKDLTDFEDSGIVTFDLKDGAKGSINFSTAVWEKNLESSLTIIAQNGSIKVGGQYMDKVEYCNIKNYIMPELEPTNPGNDYGHYKGSAQNHNFVIDNVVNVLKERDSISTNVFEGMKVVEIIENIYNST